MSEAFKIPKKPIPGPKPFAAMTPEERTLWLAKHNVPAGYVLVTLGEIENIGQGLAAEHQNRILVQRINEETADALDHYWRTEPDLQNAAASAVFDARRYHRACEIAAPAIDIAISTCATLSNLVDGGCDEAEAANVVLPTISTLADALAKALREVRELHELRRERAPLKPEGRP